MALPLGRRVAFVLGVTALAAFPGGAHAQTAPANTQASPPQQTAALSREQMRQFLTTAKIVSGKDIEKGVTHPVRLTLSDGTITHQAAFSAVDEHIPVMHFSSGRTELDFVDSYRFNVAAYRVAELLGLEDMMPVTVEREYQHHKGSLTWWLDVKMDEGERLKKQLRAPDPVAWNQQMHRMRVFTQLVGDTDRNVGNILISEDWKIWMIDFTRAFRRTKKLLSAGELAQCDRQLLQRLRVLTAEQVAASTKSFIGGAEIDALMARRDLIVAFFDKLVAEKGEAQVLY
jgi:hypothetical protein